jgi:hypothetical protein
LGDKNGSQRESCCTDWAPAAPFYLSFPFAIKGLEAAFKLPHRARQSAGHPAGLLCVVPSRRQAGAAECVRLSVGLDGLARQKKRGQDKYRRVQAGSRILAGQNDK